MKTISQSQGDPDVTEDIEDDLASLPEEDESVQAIIAEMEALKAVFSVAFEGEEPERVKNLLMVALQLKENPMSFGGRLTSYCMHICLGGDTPEVPKSDTPPDRWVQRTFEALGTGWALWVKDGSTEVLKTINLMFEHEDNEEDGAIDTLILNFWAQAIEMLIRQNDSEAMRLFNRANEVGAQFGTSTNIPICWTYYTSFFLKRIR